MKLKQLWRCRGRYESPGRQALEHRPASGAMGIGSIGISTMTVWLFPVILIFCPIVVLGILLTRRPGCQIVETGSGWWTTANQISVRRILSIELRTDSQSDPKSRGNYHVCIASRYIKGRRCELDSGMENSKSLFGKTTPPGKRSSGADSRNRGRHL